MTSWGFGVDIDWWETLSVYESRDYVAKWYLQRHGRTLNAGRTGEVASCFTQGREYFDAARLASASVRPLLLYYGVLSVSRGVILLRDKTKNEESLKPSHGLEVVDWGGTLSGGLPNVLSLKIRVTNGTFGELASAAGNQHFTSWWTQPGFREASFYADLGDIQFLSDGSVIELDDLLSRDYRFLSLYPKTTGRIAKVHVGEVVHDPSNQIEVALYGPPMSVEDMLARFHVPEGTPVAMRGMAKRHSIPNVYFALSGTPLGLPKHYPMVDFIGNDGMFIAEPFSNGDNMSSLLRTYLLSYILGMLVRYYPSRWISLLRNEKGDTAQPVLKAAVSTVTRDYPKLIAQHLS